MDLWGAKGIATLGLGLEKQFLNFSNYYPQKNCSQLLLFFSEFSVTAQNQIQIQIQILFVYPNKWSHDEILVKTDFLVAARGREEGVSWLTKRINPGSPAIKNAQNPIQKIKNKKGSENSR